MFNTIYHKHDIVEIKNFITREESSSIIKYLDSDLEKWTVFNETFTKCYGMPLSFDDKKLNSFNLDNNIFEKINNDFKNNITNIFNKNFKEVTYHAQKWNAGGTVEPHSDISDLEGNLNNNSTNKYTVILYLNDDYLGGELYFPQHNLSIKPSAGSIVMFPGDHTNIHGVSKVTDGIRYTLVSWWDISDSNEDINNFIEDKLYTNEKIFYYKGIIKYPKTILEKIDSLDQPWKFYPTKPGNEKFYKRNTYEFTEYKNIDMDIIGKELIDCIEDYCIKNNINIKRFDDVVVNKAYPGKHTGEHSDSWDINSCPSITIIVDLNDNYGGGELIFPKQNFKLKSKAGSIIIYPSFEPYSHIPSLITSGNKISCIIFGFTNE